MAFPFPKPLLVPFLLFPVLRQITGFLTSLLLDSPPQQSGTSEPPSGAKRWEQIWSLVV